MSATIEYTLIAEGFAEYAFIPVYLKRLATGKGVVIKKSSLDLLKKQPSKSKVLALSESLCLRALRDEMQAFCIVGVDLDGPDQTDEQVQHEAECNGLIKALGSAHKRYGENIILYVPVQAIEHWLIYQAYQTKPITKPENWSVEKEPPTKLKKLLYGDKEDGRRMQNVAKAIAEKADFDELVKQSRSFAHFHKQIIAILENYEVTPS